MKAAHLIRSIGPAVLALTLALAYGPGCATSPATTQPSSVSEDADQALRDPFNYKQTSDFHDISGGGLTDLNKDAFKRDVDHVLNP